MAAPSEPLVYYDSGTCPYAQRAWLTLLEKKLPFEQVLVSLQDKPQDFKDLYSSIHPDPNAPAKVPILIDGDTKLIESAVVVDYLEHKFSESGTQLLPSDPEQRAKVRFFVEVYNERYAPQIFKLIRADTQQAVVEGTEAMVAALKVLDAFLRKHGSEEGGAYLLGSSYTLAELLTSPFFLRAQYTLPHFRGVDPAALIEQHGLDRLKRWLEAALARPALQETSPTPESVIEGYGKFVTPLKD